MLQHIKTFCLALSIAIALAAAPGASSGNRILVYTHNGKGYVHDNRPAAVEAIRELGRQNGFEVDSSDDPSVFTTENLKKYKALVFASTNNETFDTEAQRTAFRRYIESGGGLVGLHIATGSERNWPYYQAVIGGKFLRHPPLQKFTVLVKDSHFPATKSLPATFEWEDECYFHENLNPDIKVLLTADPSQLNDPKKELPAGERIGGLVPLSWYHTYGGGREYFLGLGHKIEHYSNPVIRQQVLGGILWAMGLVNTHQKQVALQRSYPR